MYVCVRVCLCVVIDVCLFVVVCVWMSSCMFVCVLPRALLLHSFAFFFVLSCVAFVPFPGAPSLLSFDLFHSVQCSLPGLGSWSLVSF